MRSINPNRDQTTSLRTSGKMKHHPMTEEQRTTLNQDLAAIMETLSEIANLLNACYGDTDPRATRAAELHAAGQRLLWAMSRETTAPVSGNGMGLRRVREMSTAP
jgi:hypothetical protein